MADSVVNLGVYSYERGAILQWLSMNTESPMTWKPLSERDLRPNRALKEVIRQYLGNRDAHRVQVPASEQN